MQDKAVDEAGFARGRVLRNAGMAVVIAWSMRAVGLVSVLVLARILTPRDFGIIGLAMSVLALVEIFSALGLRQSLLRIQEPERGHYDTAWTIQLLLLIVLAVLLVAMGPVAAWFYSEPALAAVIAVLAIRFLFYGLVNIGIVDFDRHLQLGRDLRLRMAVRLGTFAATVIAALLLRNYWALVIGAVAQSVLHAAGSYVAHPYRPRFSLAKRAELLGVSLWIFAASASQTIYQEIERLFAGRIGSMQLVGLYSVSKGLSSIFTEEIATALNRVTFVTTAQNGRALSDQPDRLKAMLGSYALIVAPLGLGLAATAEQASAVLLGPQWAGAAPFLQLVAPAAALFAVHKLIISSLQASGSARQAAFLAASGTAVLAGAAAIVALTGGGALSLAAAALVTSAALLLCGLSYLGRSAGTGFVGLFLPVARPFLAAVAMMLAVRQVAGFGGGPLLELVLSATVGAVVYVLASGAIWFASARPAGAEATVAQLIKSAVSTYLRRAPASQS